MIENGGTMRRSRSYRSYKFTDKHHSKGGILATVAGSIALICTLVDLYFVYKAKGEAGEIVALFGMIALICSIYGVVVGKRSFKEEEVYYLFSRLGTFLSLILMIFWIAVAVMGFVM